MIIVGRRLSYSGSFCVMHSYQRSFNPTNCKNVVQHHVGRRRVCNLSMIIILLIAILAMNQQSSSGVSASVQEVVSTAQTTTLQNPQIRGRRLHTNEQDKPSEDEQQRNLEQQLQENVQQKQTMLKDSIQDMDQFVLDLIRNEDVGPLSIMTRSDDGGSSMFGPTASSFHGLSISNPDIRLGFIGNSMLYFNDSPRLIEQMILSADISVTQDSCFMGGSTLTTLWEGGCGYTETFGPTDALQINDDGTSEYIIGPRKVEQFLLRYNEDMNTIMNTRDDGYDFIVMNDNSQGPARDFIKFGVIETIKQHYAPTLRLSGKGNVTSIPIIVQTPAYRQEGAQNSYDLGSFDNFSSLLREGVRQYKEAFDAQFKKQDLNTTYDDDFYDYDDLILNTNSSTISPTTTVDGNEMDDENNDNGADVKARIAPVGDAYQYIYENDIGLFDKLYTWDNYHPSPTGSYVFACVLFLTIFPDRMEPPSYNPQWWKYIRYFAPPPDNAPYYNTSSTGLPPLPSFDEANKIRKVAQIVTGRIQDDNNDNNDNNNNENNNDENNNDNGNNNNNNNNNGGNSDGGDTSSDPPSVSPTENVENNIGMTITPTTPYSGDDSYHNTSDTGDYNTNDGNNGDGSNGNDTVQTVKPSSDTDSTMELDDTTNNNYGLLNSTTVPSDTNS